MWSYLPIAPQCCDAFSYVAQGASCAVADVCAGGIRPIGDYYWFSIPVRFGLPLNSLILLNVLLMLMSACLSAAALAKIIFSNIPRFAGWLNTAVLLLISLAVHFVFFYPTLFHTLSDVPAGCLLLSGAALLLLSGYSVNTKKKALLLAAGGLCWGCAAWLRAFFLYPVLCGLSAYVLFFIFSRQRAWRDVWILLALLPIGFQYLYSYVHTGKFSYIDDQSSSFVTMHTSIPAAGYDTTFPSDGYFWQPGCLAGYGVIDGLKAGEFARVACLIRSRLYFYLGTYVPETYIFTNAVNKLAPTYVVRKGDTVDWWLDSFDIQPDIVAAPDGTQTGDKLVPLPSPGNRGKVYKPVMLQANTPHTFSVWLWSPLPLTVDLSIIKNYDSSIIAAQKIVLSPEPQRYFITGVTTDMPNYLPSEASMETMQYSVNINVDYAQATAIKPVSENVMYLWNAQLEASDLMTTYQPYKAAEPDEVRVWRPWLLALHIFMVLGATVAIFMQRKYWLFTPAGLSVLLTQAVIAAECLVIIPEQRFATVSMIFIWLTAASLTVYWVNKMSLKKPTWL